MKIKHSYRKRFKEYLYFANRMKRIKCNVFLSSKGAFSLPNLLESPTGKNFEEVLFIWESTGKLVPCNNLQKLHWLMVGKFARDWHITEWSEACKSGILSIKELREDGCPETLLITIRKVCYK